jgi:HSP20 family molecular chaperone IbpA
MSLVPRLWAEMTDWLEQDLMPRGIRLEDRITDSEYTVRAELPGLDPDKDIQLSVAHGVLTIRAERKEETQSMYRTEFRYGVFERSVRLPANADESKIKANYRNGILEITIPLTPVEVARRIPISSK